MMRDTDETPSAPPAPIPASSPAPHIGAAQLRELAVEASADPRTILRVARGERARGMVHDRIVQAFARRGIPLTIAAPSRTSM